MSTRALLLSAILVLPSCAAPPAPDAEPPAVAPIEDPSMPILPGPRAPEPRNPCVVGNVVGPSGFRVVAPIPCARFFRDEGDPPPEERVNPLHDRLALPARVREGRQP